MSFGGDLQKFSKKTGIRMDQVDRKVCIDLTRELVMTNPVLSGLSRSNWFMGTNRVSTVTKDENPAGAPSIARASEFASTLKSGGVWFITNNLPYILPIMQYGTSKQAASGTITRLVADWQGRLDRIVATL